MSQFKKIVIALFSLSIPLSKSGIPLFGGLLLLAALLLIASPDGRSRWKTIWRDHSFALILGLSPFWGMAFSALSSEAAAATPKFFEHLHMPILLLVMLFWFNEEKDREDSLKYFGYGMILSCLYGLYIFFTEHEGIYESDLRLASTWDVSRWGLVLMMSFIVILANRIDEREIRLSHRYFDLLLMILLPICLVLNNSRAPWLFGLIALFLYIVFLQRRYTLPFLIACSVLLASGLQLSPSFRARVATILSVQGSDQSTNNLKSTDPSNQARLTMWRIAWRVFHHAPWFGTGLEESESITRATIEQLKHEQPGFVIPRELSYRDQHSSYLTLLVQTGVFFTLVFIGLIALNILKGFRLSRLATSSQRDWGILASLLMFLMCAAVYSELVSLGSYFFWYFLGLWLKPWMSNLKIQEIRSN